MDSKTIIFDPKETEDKKKASKGKATKESEGKENKNLTFLFDHVFGEDSTQMEVFENTTQEVVDGVLNGFNCSVFAYGASGSGKTYTMLGAGDNQGVMYLTMNELFRRMELLKEEREFELAYSYVEVYNEQIHDLLQKSSKSDGTKVKTDILYPRWSKSSKEIFDALTLGSTQRTQHPTDVNASSSRSHAIFQIVIKQRERSASDNAVVCSSMEAKMNLIDLAGSENVNAANTHGIEAGKINLSLLALAEVINALSNPLRSFVPYRNSKLTWLLKDSLGGNCRTIMIINISPSSLSYEATLNTLQYAKKAKGITSTLKSNIGSTDSIGEHPFMFAQTAAVVLPDCKTSVYTNAQIKSMPNILHNTFTALRQRRKDILLCEMDYKKCQLKMMDSEERFQRHKSIGNHEAEKVTLYAQHVIKMELEALEREINTKQRYFQEVDNWINKLEHEFTLLGEPGQKLKKKLKWHRLNMQLTDLQEQCEHIKYLYHLKEKEHKLTCNLVHSLLAAHHRQCQTLKAAGLPVDADQEKLLGYLVQRDEDDEEVECDTSLLEFSHITLDQSTPSNT